MPTTVPSPEERGEKNSPKKAPAKPSNDPLLARRGWIKTAFRRTIVGTAAVASAFVIDDVCRSPDGNLKRVEAEKGNHTLVYSNHTLPNNPRIVDGADGIVLENSGIDYLDQEKYQVQMKVLETDVQYGPIIRAAHANQKPLFFGDISKSLPRPSETNYARTAEAFAGASLALCACIMRGHRRGFITGAMSTGAAYLISPSLESNMLLIANGRHGIPNESTPSRQVQRALAAFNTAVHPEMTSITVHGRDANFAQKGETIAGLLARRLRLRTRKPELRIVVGSAHFGIEKKLLLPEPARIGYMREAFGAEHVRNEQWILQATPVPANGEELQWDFQLIADPAYTR